MTIGEKLMQYYGYLKEQAGLDGKVELAKETQLPGTKASTAPDSEENIRKFREAVEEITGERPPSF